MRKLFWIALTTTALLVTNRSSRADEPATLVDAAAAAPATTSAPEPVMAEPAAGGQNCSTCGSECSTCGKGQRRVARFLDWLIYVPLDHGKTKCCPVCESCPPPAWAFFPCTGGGRCSACSACGSTLYYAKEAGAVNSNQVVHSAYPPSTAAKPAAETTARVSSYKPQSISEKMPILDPIQFRKAKGN